jgi:hypothetical protein
MSGGTRKTLDTDIISLREIYAKTALNQIIPADHVLITNGDNSTRWGSVSSIYATPFFSSLKGTTGPIFYADDANQTIHISTTGSPGLFTSYIDPANKALMISSSQAALGISQEPVPSVSAGPALAPPRLSTLTNYSTLNFIGVRDVLLSTVTNVTGASPAVFIAISTFTSQGYLAISGEAFAWRPYVNSTLSTAAGLASFVSTMPVAWTRGVDLPLSTIEAYPNYTTGDVYFSTVSFNMVPYIGYIKGGSTKLFLEVNPTYAFPRFFLGSQEYPNIIKNISTYVQYQSPTVTTPVTLPTTVSSDLILSQQSNAFTSNYFTKNMMIPFDTTFVRNNWSTDGSNGYYTLYHRIPGGMAALVPGDACGYGIGGRSGMSNPTPTYDNLTPVSNGTLLHIYNQIPFP